MRHFDISYGTIISAVRNKWKSVLLTVFCFSFLGLVVGFLGHKHGDIQGSGSAEALKLISVDSIPYDANYYIERTSSVRALYDDLGMYLDAIYENHTLTERQLTHVKSLRDELKTIGKTYLDDIVALGHNESQPCIPVEFLQEEIQRCEVLYATYKSDLESAQAAKDLLDIINEDSLDGKDSETAYQTLLQTAATLPEYMRVSEIFDTRLEWLNSPDEISKNNQKLSILLDDAVRALNELAGKSNSAAMQIAEDNHIHIKLHYTGADRGYYSLIPVLGEQIPAKAPLEVGIAHSFTVSRAEDFFVVTVLFCTLVGICVGAFFAVCREATGKKSQ